MKFVYFGYDFAIDTLRRLLQEGHELIGIFTFPCDNIFTFNTQLQELAQANSIPFTTDQPNQATIDHLTEKGCNVFLSIGYLYKIPIIDETKAYGVNVHPSLLPKGRGMMPLPTVLMSEPDAAGITAHKITPDIDAGDILAQQTLKVHDNETIETLSCRVAMKTPDMVSNIMNDLQNKWSAAKPQNQEQATIFPVPNDAMRTINWDSTIQDIAALHRAFGRFGVLFKLHDDMWAGYNLDVWQEDHSHASGTQVHITARELIIAAKDGYVCIKEAEKLQMMS